MTHLSEDSDLIGKGGEGRASGRATHASHQAPAGLGHSVGIPDAVTRLERSTWDSRVLPNKQDIATLLDALKGDPGVCRNCDGTEWVCEDHRDRPWDGLSSSIHSCRCGGAGAPCPVCSPLARPPVDARRVLKDFNGGLVNESDPKNKRGYTTYYQPLVAMRRALAAQAIPTREGGDAEQAPFMGSATPKGCAQ